VYLDAAYDHSDLRRMLGDYPPPPAMQPRDSASPAAVQAYLARTFGMHIPEAQLRAIGRYDGRGHLLADVTPARIDSLVLAGCGHPWYGAVRARSLAIYAVVDSAPQLFPAWASLDARSRAAARRFTAAFQAWGATERGKVRREVRGARVIELPGANHYVFSSHPAVVAGTMRALLDRPGD
jgi:pimeloyl-ACP methyl ester carboxylesterase